MPSNPHIPIPRFPRPRICCAVLILATLFGLPAVFGQSRDPYLPRRLAMVRKYLERDGISDKRVLKSMRSVPRHEFVFAKDRHLAYLDGVLPIGYKQTISPPFVVSYMTQTIEPKATDRVLEVGTGSGYQAAILSGLVKDVYTIEIVPQLGKIAAGRLKRLGYNNVHPKVGDGYKGWPEKAPFDKIIVTCSPENVPKPLVEQLKEGGKLLIPLGQRYQQVFYLYEKKDGKLSQKKLIPTLFVPMTGISEDNRKVKPDPAHPTLINNSFEKDDNKDDRPDNWHYQRQISYMKGNAPDGKRYVIIENAEPGRRAQLLQGMGFDGRKVKRVRLSATIRYTNLRRGTQRYHIPGIYIFFFDSIRRPIGYVGFPPLLGTQKNWETVATTLKVPANAREAVVHVGLNQGTGRLEVDNVQLTPSR